MVFSTITFYPSLLYNLARNYVSPERWTWFNRIDDTLLLGAIPFKSMATQLTKKENVGGVVCCTEDFETKMAGAMREEDWRALGVAFHHIPMVDFTGSASRQNIHQAVTFIDDITQQGKSVYVHCKAGRTRSATVAASYLMKKHNWLPNVAVECLRDSRHQVLLRNAQWRTLNEYRRYLDSNTFHSLSS